MEKTLVLTVGLPRSGKSTWALKSGFPIVNRDAIRLALHGEPYIQKAESIVTALEHYMVRSLFLAGHDIVVVDACNLKFEYRQQWMNSRDWITKVKVFQESKEVCIKRAALGSREDLIPVIERMWPDAEDLSYLVKGGLNYG